MGDEHPDTARMYCQLGALCERLGESNTARTDLERSLTIRRKQFGEQHPDTAQSYTALGILAEDLADYAAAHAYFEHAIPIYRKTFGEVSGVTAQDYLNLRGLYELVRQYGTARTYYQRALDINAKCLVTNTPARLLRMAVWGACADSPMTLRRLVKTTNARVEHPPQGIWGRAAGGR